MRRINKDNDCDHGAVLRDEGFVLATLAHLANGPVVEFGTLRGASARFLSQATPHLVTTFDPHPQVGFEAGSGVHQERRCSSEVVSLYKPGHFAMAFIDADHSEEAVLGDLNRCNQLEIPIVVCHDASGDFWPGVPRALERFDGPYEWLYLPTGCGLAVGRRHETK